MKTKACIVAFLALGPFCSCVWLRELIAVTGERTFFLANLASFLQSSLLLGHI
jgi:hypothetical protein